MDKATRRSIIEPTDKFFELETQVAREYFANLSKLGHESNYPKLCRHKDCFCFLNYSQAKNHDPDHANDILTPKQFCSELLIKEIAKQVGKLNGNLFTKISPRPSPLHQSTKNSKKSEKLESGKEESKDSTADDDESSPSRPPQENKKLTNHTSITSLLEDKNYSKKILIGHNKPSEPTSSSHDKLEVNIDPTKSDPSILEYLKAIHKTAQEGFKVGQENKQAMEKVNNQLQETKMNETSLKQAIKLLTEKHSKLEVAVAKGKTSVESSGKARATTKRKKSESKERESNGNKEEEGAKNPKAKRVKQNDI